MKTFITLIAFGIATTAFAESGAVILDSLKSLNKGNTKKVSTQELGKKQTEDCTECRASEKEKKQIENCPECTAAEKSESKAKKGN